MSAFLMVESLCAMTKVVRPSIRRASPTLHLKLAMGIEAAGRLIHNEYGRVFKYGPGYAQPLSLSAREFYAALPYNGVVAPGQGGDKVVGVRAQRGLFD